MKRKIIICAVFPCMLACGASADNIDANLVSAASINAGSSNATIFTSTAGVSTAPGTSGTIQTWVVTPRSGNGSPQSMTFESYDTVSGARFRYDLTYEGFTVHPTNGVVGGVNMNGGNGAVDSTLAGEDSARIDSEAHLTTTTGQYEFLRLTVSNLVPIDLGTFDTLTLKGFHALTLKRIGDQTEAGDVMVAGDPSSPGPPTVGTTSVASWSVLLSDGLNPDAGYLRTLSTPTLSVDVLPATGNMFIRGVGVRVEGSSSTIPSAPSGLMATATPGSGEIVLNWNDNDPGENVTSYNIYRSTSPGITLPATPWDPSATSDYTDIFAADETKYYYAVTAVNSGAVESLLSTEISAILLNPPFVNVSDTTGIGVVEALLKGVVTASGGENPTVTFGYGTTNPGTNDPNDWANKVVVGTAGGSFQRRVTNLLPNTTYLVQAFATNSAGSAFSTNDPDFLGGTVEQFTTLPVPGGTAVDVFAPTPGSFETSGGGSNGGMFGNLTNTTTYPGSISGAARTIQTSAWTYDNVTDTGVMSFRVDDSLNTGAVFTFDLQVHLFNSDAGSNVNQVAGNLGASSIVPNFGTSQIDADIGDGAGTREFATVTVANVQSVSGPAITSFGLSGIQVKQTSDANDEGAVYVVGGSSASPTGTWDYDVNPAFAQLVSAGGLPSVTVEPTGGAFLIQGFTASFETGAGGGNDFSDWIATFPGAAGDTSFGGDPDGDGVGSGLENFFGTDPGVFTAGLVSGVVDDGAGTFTFTHPQSGTPADDVSAPAYTWSTDLATFTADGVANGGSTVSFSTALNTPSAGITTVTATVTGTPVSQLFVRVAVTQN